VRAGEVDHQVGEALDDDVRHLGQRLLEKLDPFVE
jgi:hypothetical protein